MNLRIPEKRSENDRINKENEKRFLGLFLDLHRTDKTNGRTRDIRRFACI